VYQQVATDITEAPPIATMNDGASFSNRTSKTPAEFEGFKKIIGVL
jgi:hypothetical protein